MRPASPPRSSRESAFWRAVALWCLAAIGVLAGAGFLLYAATHLVVFVNLLLWPFVNQQLLSSTELEVGYMVSATCRSRDEAHIRRLLVEDWAARLNSEDLEETGRVVVRAFATAAHRVNAHVEKIADRVSLESTVSAHVGEPKCNSNPKGAIRQTLP